MNMNGFESLCNAIVERAARDYEEYLCDDHHNSTRETRGRLKEIESYFKGDEIKWHTKLDGVKLMNAIKQRVIAYNYDLKALNKARREFDKKQENEEP